MHKKLLLLLFTSTLLLGACAEDTDTDDSKEVDDAIEETAEEETEIDEDLDKNEESDKEQQAGDVIEAELGTRTVVKTNYGINESKESGPFEIIISDAQLSQFQPSEDMVDVFGGEDLAMVGIEMTVENKSEDTNTIYPDQGILVTDTGKQVDAELFISDDLGGDFHGEVTKDGQVFFFFDGQADDISEVRYLITAAQDDGFENIGEDLEFVIEF